MFGLYLLFAGMERFLIELLRAKDDRFLGAFTLAQLTSVAAIVLGFVLLARWTRKDDLPIPADAVVLQRAG
jgi:phosphatidylglycerol:prolipoprotein diacylglycerol transferase